ncbi:MAG: hypothetical protein ACMXX9_04615 [Candidatus Woesearchaeota archaeon]
MKLLAWLKKFVEYRNSFKREKLDIKEENNFLIVDNSKTLIKYLVFDDLSDLSVNLTTERVVCLNNKKNVDWLVNNWKKVCGGESFFLFVNPDTNEHWTIRPKHHDLVVEDGELEKGLIALMESIAIYE